MPISGTIEFEGSVIKKVYLEFEDDVIIKSDINGDLIIVDPNEIDPNATDPSCFEYAFNYEYKVDYDACDEFIAEKNESEENSNSSSVFGDMSCREAELYLGMDLKNIFSLMVNDSMIYEEMLNEGIVEEVKKDTIAITNYICGGVEGAEGVIRNVVIPKRLDGKTVTAIAPGAFSTAPIKNFFGGEDTSSDSVEEDSDLDEIIKEHLIESVEFPNSIIKLGALSFGWNEIETVEFPEKLEIIELGVFGDNKLEEIVLPETLTLIGPGAFYMNNLEVIEIPNRVKIIGFLAFAGGKEKKLKSVTIYKNKDDIENLFVPDNNFLRTFE